MLGMLWGAVVAIPRLRTRNPSSFVLASHGVALEARRAVDLLNDIRSKHGVSRVKLSGIVAAQQQLVAGLLYTMCIQVRKTQGVSSKRSIELKYMQPADKVGTVFQGDVLISAMPTQAASQEFEEIPSLDCHTNMYDSEDPEQDEDDDRLTSRPIAVMLATSADPLPGSLDPRDLKNHPCVSTILDVSDQGECSNCYAHAGVGAVAINHCFAQARGNETVKGERLSIMDYMVCGKPRQFSPQAQTKLYLSYENPMSFSKGCDAHYSLGVFAFAVKYGLAAEACQPYPSARIAEKVSSLENNCSILSSPPLNPECRSRALMQAYNEVYGEDNMMRTILEHGSLTWSFPLFSNFWNLPKNEVYKMTPKFFDQQETALLSSEAKNKCRADRTRCSVFEGRHEVVVVGWGSDPVQGPYWIMRNSWGKSVGDQGFQRVSRQFRSVFPTQWRFEMGAYPIAFQQASL